MLVGNDFLPPLPTLDIAEGALNSLFSIYKEELPRLGGYLTHQGEFDPGRLQTILARVAALEAGVLAERAREAEEQAEKKGRRESREARRGGAQPARRAPTELSADELFEGELAEAVAAAVEEPPPPDPSMMRADKRAMFLQEGGGGLARWREAYYEEKLELGSRGEPADAALARLCAAYVEGLAWVLAYYYRGVASWGWFYPYHYAPMAGDLAHPRLARLAAAVSFQQGAPFAPFEQLLAVLPAGSAALLPPAHRPLMLAAESPIRDFYPADFRIDWEGKRNDWEGVVQVPFIDEARLLAAVRAAGEGALSGAERARNAPGHVFTFVHRATVAEDYPSSLPRSFPPLRPSRSLVTQLAPPPPLPAGVLGFTPRLLKGTATGRRNPPGFPTLRTFATHPRLAEAGCNVFGMASKKESLLLRIDDFGGGETLGAEQVAVTALGDRVFVAWPYLQEALIVAVSDAAGRLASPGVSPGSKRWSKAESEEWQAEAGRLAARALTQTGVDVGRVAVLLHVRACEGLVKHADGSLQKSFSGSETAYPLQATLQRASGLRVDALLVERGPEEQPPLALAQPALFLGRSHFGALAHVVDGPGSDGTYAVSVLPEAPDAGTAKRVFAGAPGRFERSGAVARKLRLSPRLLGQLTGAVWVRIDDSAKVDVGLNLKSAKHGLCVPDYCRPTKEDDGWEYSDATARLIAAYAQQAPWLVRALGEEADSGPGGLDLRKAFPALSPAEAARHVYAAAAWLAKQPVRRRPLVKTASRCPPEEALRALYTATSVPPPTLPPVLLERVAPLLLLPPLEEREASSVLAGGDFELGDRLVVVTAGGAAAPPFGARGCCVGIHPWEVGCSLEVLFDRAFEGASDLHGRLPTPRGFLLPSTHCLNLSHPPPLPSLGAWAPPQRARRAPPAVAPRSAWAAEGTPAEGGALAAAKAALSQLGLPPPPPPPPAPAPAPAAAALAPAEALAAASERLSLGKEAPPRPRASGGRGAAPGRGAGRQSAEASGPAGFSFEKPQGRGRGGAARAAPAPALAPAPAPAPAALVPAAAEPNAGASLLAMVQGGAAPPPRPRAAPPATATPGNAGAALLAMVQPPGGGAAAAAPAAPVAADAAAMWASLSGAGGGSAGAVAGASLLALVQGPKA